MPITIDEPTTTAAERTRRTARLAVVRTRPEPVPAVVDLPYVQRKPHPVVLTALKRY